MDELLTRNEVPRESIILGILSEQMYVHVAQLQTFIRLADALGDFHTSAFPQFNFCCASADFLTHD